MIFFLEKRSGGLRQAGSGRFSGSRVNYFDISFLQRITKSCVLQFTVLSLQKGRYTKPLLQGREKTEKQEFLISFP